MRSKAWLKTINISFICCRFVFTQNWNHFLQGLCFKACSWECFENTVRIRSLCFLVSKVLLNILNRNFKTWKSEFFASALYCCHIWCGTSCKFRFQHFNGWSFWRRLSLHYCQVFLMRLFMISFHLNIFFRELHFPQEMLCLMCDVGRLWANWRIATLRHWGGRFEPSNGHPAHPRLFVSFRYKWIAKGQPPYKFLRTRNLVLLDFLRK